MLVTSVVFLSCMENPKRQPTLYDACFAVTPEWLADEVRERIATDAVDRIIDHLAESAAVTVLDHWTPKETRR